jgi:CBS domain-containing protein
LIRRFRGDAAQHYKRLAQDYIDGSHPLPVFPRRCAVPYRPIRHILSRRTLVTAAESTTVAEAARLMNDAGVGAILVLRREKLVGIFTERDALSRVLAAGLDPVHTKLSQVMTAKPDTIAPDKPFGHALIAMYEHGYRHMPVVENGRPVGVVSMRDARPPELDDLEHDLEDRRHIAEILG